MMPAQPILRLAHNSDKGEITMMPASTALVRPAAKLLSKDEARRIAANVTLGGQPQRQQSRRGVNRSGFALSCIRAVVSDGMVPVLGSRSNREKPLRRSRGRISTFCGLPTMPSPRRFPPPWSVEELEAC